MIGNMEGLAQGSETWEEISRTLLRMGCIGEELSLKCKDHGLITKVSVGSDFNKIGKGGCSACKRIFVGQANWPPKPKSKPKKSGNGKFYFSKSNKF
jgi:hypothetical protein